ncbi:uncharacterized protein LOC132304038 isoform X4 [Cornus florida]|uniref:uncharacterized protein LOC132304038 isoform X4 n=1 Tax=Cornus florida TaxID=4283 RepID=UPI0028973EAD|nr:uncharacterized protein LOC132304038 isoform X4 [Cornus florida]
MSICDYYQYEEANYSCSYNDRIVMLFCQQDKQHEAPMPWIGIYVAAASLVCSLAMAADVFHGFRHRKLWIPCKFFTLNAASLTLLGVAMKLPVDLSTQMPGNMDQLVKLTGTVLMSTTMVSTLMSFGLYYKVLKQKLRYCKPTTSNNHREPESGPGTTLDLSRYVIYLEGEEELPLQIMKNNRDATNHFIQKGKKQQPKYLKELLDQSTAFMGVEKFDSDRVPFLNSEEPPNCWSLPVITLTSIAIALPNNENQKVNWLRRSVREGLLYVNLVEKILDAKGDLVSIKNTADIVWFGVDLFGKWLDEDLRKIALERKTSKETLERLLDISKNIVMEFKANMNGKENPLKWPMKVIAANSMYRISQTLLLDQEGSKDQMDHERLFDQLSVMVADILGACLTNMPRVITTKCFCSAIEEREKNVQHAAHLLGETEEILEILQQRELPSLNPDQAADINEWRASMKKKDPSAFTSSSNSGSSSSGSCQLHIAIE